MRTSEPLGTGVLTLGTVWDMSIAFKQILRFCIVLTLCLPIIASAGSPSGMPRCGEAVAHRILQTERRLSSESSSCEARFDLAYKSALAFGQAVTDRANAYRERFYLDTHDRGSGQGTQSHARSAPRLSGGKLTLYYDGGRGGDVMAGNVRFVRISSYSSKGTGKTTWRRRVESTYGPRDIFERIGAGTFADKIKSSPKLSKARQTPAIPLRQLPSQEGAAAEIESETAKDSRRHPEAAHQVLTDISDAQVEQSTGDLMTAFSGLNEICEKAVETYDAMLSVKFDSKSDSDADIPFRVVNSRE